MDQYIETSVPRKGIRDINKSRLIALTCLPLSDATTASLHAASAAAAAASTSAAGQQQQPLLPVPAPLQSCDLLRVLGLSESVRAQWQQRHALAALPAGTCTDFRIAPGGCASWWHVTHGKLVSSKLGSAWLHATACVLLPNLWMNFSLFILYP